MRKTRVWELARQLSMDTGQMMAKLSELGVSVRNPNSILDDAATQSVVDLITEERKRAEARPKKTRTVTVGDTCAVPDLAKRLETGTAQLQKALIGLGAFVNINQTVDFDLAARVAEQFGAKLIREEGAEAAAKPSEVDQAEAEARAPVVTVLGHVDHGKTTLLDSIRETKVTETEHGGITQHIGAYQIKFGGKEITFIDTPGHEAFTAMRARGANLTDIAVLVVAADDGVMPQTKEAIDHANAAGVPIIVAVNKIDKPDANPDRTKQQLSDLGLVPEEWGGKTITVDVSAKEKVGLDALLEMILLVAEMGELKARRKGLAVGSVIEAKLDKGRGPVATVLLERGVLSVGNSVVVGEAHGRIKAMHSADGSRVVKAFPADAIEIVGLDRVPTAGDRVEEVSNDKEARRIAEARVEAAKREQPEAHITLEDLGRRVETGELRELPIVLKCDVHGSAEAVGQALTQLSDEDVKVSLIHEGVGPITESDILLATASNAIVVGFNVRTDPRAEKMAEQESVQIRNYNVIYELTQDISDAMLGLLEPVYEEVPLGSAEVRQLFRLPGRLVAAGCHVTEGKMVRGGSVRVIRDDQEIHTGTLSSLKHVKEDVKEIAADHDCGIQIDGFNEFAEGDRIVSFEMREVPRSRRKK
jgi:translation initiation factor IF-2